MAGKPDYIKAMVWFQHAVTDGSAFAAIRIGRLYEDGHGVPRDYDKALQWFVKAGGGGNRTAGSVADLSWRLTLAGDFQKGYDTANVAIGLAANRSRVRPAAL